jgi:hypothetical protein
MRIASRVVGVVLALAGLACFALCFLALLGSFERRSVLAEAPPSPDTWAVSGSCAAIGIGLIVVAWYYLRMDAKGEDSPKAPSRADLHAQTKVSEDAAEI